MAVTSTQVTVGTTPTLLAKADADGCRVIIHKLKNHAIYVGGANVTIANGFLFDHDGTMDFDLSANDALYAVIETTPETAYVMTVSNS